MPEYILRHCLNFSNKGMAIFMDFITLLFVAVGLAMDAFSVAVTDGIVIKKVKVVNALKVALFFGIFQFGMLFVGNLLGSAFSKYISTIDHWIAFILLMVIGGKMFFEAIFEKEEKEEENKKENPLDNKVLTVLAIATSIDALAVGVSFVAMQNVGIVYSASVVGIVAFVFSFAGMYIGNKFGNLFGNKSEIIGGIVLMGIGIKILVEHLFF